MNFLISIIAATADYEVYLLNAVMIVLMITGLFS